MKSVAELCNLYIAWLRSIYLVHQNSHWLTKGKTFYGDHLLFERLYTGKIVSNADGAAEKFIGVFSDDCLAPNIQAQLIGKITAKYASSNPVENSLAIEKDFLEFSQKFYDKLKAEDAMTLGIDDFVMGVANDREESVYLLQQVLKSGGNDKVATRKKFLQRIKNAVEAPQTLQAKLLSGLQAIVLSYITGVFNERNMTVSVDEQNRKIIAHISLTTPVKPELQQKIENNFKEYAVRLLGDTAGYTIGVGFDTLAMPGNV